MKKIILFPLLLISIFAFSQNMRITPELKGTIKDAKNSELLPFANVALMQNGEIVVGTQTDFDGYYQFDKIPTDTYSLQISFMGYQTKVLNGIAIWEGQTRDLNITLKDKGMEIICCVIYCIRPNRIIEPTVDLFVEQDSINKAEDKLVPSTGFESSIMEVDFKAYPNPTQGLITLTNMPKTDKMLLMDVNGKVIQTITVFNQSSTTLDLGRLQRGMYLLKYQESGQQKVKKLMRQ